MRTSVTNIRLSEKEGREALHEYIFGGRFGPRKVPRGIDPRVVNLVLAEKLMAGLDQEDAPKALDVARFYETRAIAAATAKTLVNAPVGPGDVILHAWLVMLAADFDDADSREKAARHFETKVISHPQALQFTPLLLEVPKVIAPAPAFEALEKRLLDEQKRLAEFQQRSEAEMMAYDKVAGWMRNDLPRAKGVAELKGKLAATPRESRMEALVRYYLNPGDDYLQIWAARQLRQDAFAGDVDPTGAFRSRLAPMTDDELRDQPDKALVFWRAERAFRYFGGVIDDRILEQRMAAAPGGTDFLDDDD